VNGRVILDNCCDLSSILLDKFSSPKADSAESLDIKGFILNTFGLEQTVFDERFFIKECTDAIVDSKTSTFGTTCDTTLVNEFSCGAAFSINVAFTVH
jgi:hypothetical protein